MTRRSKPISRMAKASGAAQRGELDVRRLEHVVGGGIEITDYGFGVSAPTTTSRSDGGGATVGRTR